MDPPAVLARPARACVPLSASFESSAAGQITSITYGNGVTTDYSYNPQTLRLDRLLSTGASGTLQDFRYSFDRVGNVTAIQDFVHTGSQSFAYDDLHRLTQASGSYGTQTYAYDAIGNMTSKEGVQMTYGAGAAGPHAVTMVGDGQTLTYDANGNLLKKSPAALSLEPTAQLFSYDAENRLVDVKTAPTETVNLTFQPGWNFFALPVIPEDGAVAVLLPSFAQDFEQIAKFEPATNSFKHYVGHPPFDDFTNLEYGTGYQVYCKNASPVTLSFTGKLPTQAPSALLTAGWHLLPATTADAPQALGTWLTGVSYSQVKRVTSATGTLTDATQAEKGQAYWVQVSTASTWTPPMPKDVTTRFTYDGDGGRVKQTTAAGATTFLGQSYEIAPDGTKTKYVFAGSQRICAVAQSLQPGAQSQLRFYHTDHLGSSNVITDGAGQVVEVAEYTPYGALASRTGSVHVPQKFTGQRLDAATGLYFYQARYYDPTLGRFISPDPFVQSPADPQTLNRYAYCRNNPINFVDPSGYGFWRKFIAAVAAIVVAVVVAAVTLIVTENPYLAVGAGLAAGGATYQAIAGSGGGSTRSNGGGAAPPASASSAPSSSPTMPEGAQGPASPPPPGSSPARAPPPWLRPLLQLTIRTAQRLANWDERTASVVEAATSDESVALLPGISPSGPRFVHERLDGSRYWSYSPRPTLAGGSSPLRRAAKSLTTYYNDPGRLLRHGGRVTTEFGHPRPGRLMGFGGLVLEPGGPGEIVGLASGGMIGAAIGRGIGASFGGVAGALVLGTIGGWFGSLFDPEGAGFAE